MKDNYFSKVDLFRLHKSGNLDKYVLKSEQSVTRVGLSVMNGIPFLTAGQRCAPVKGHVLCSAAWSRPDGTPAELRSDAPKNGIDQLFYYYIFGSSTMWASA